MKAPTHPHKRKALIFLAIFFLALIFSIYTKHTWEDWYITYRCSKNLATGNGLVFTPHEKVHAFTSPLGTLIPAFFNIITSNTSDGLVLWLMRILGCVILGASALLLLKIAEKIKLGAFATFLLLALFASNIHILDFSINGMESGLMIFFLTLTLHSLFSPAKRAYLYVGLSGAGLMWTRPDGFIYWGSVCLAAFLFGPPESQHCSFRAQTGFYLKAAAVMFILFLPWMLWAQYFYGSFIPHTVIAKGLGNTVYAVLQKIVVFDFKSVRYVFMPAYYFFGGWNSNYAAYAQLLAWGCALFWIIPFDNRDARSISFALLLSHVYLSFITHYPHPWYLPMPALLSILVIALAAQRALDSFGSPNNTSAARRKVVYAFLLIPLAISIAATLLSAYQLRIRQRVIEDGTRKQIGLWLKEHAATSADTVFLEPLGYIGFFSQLKMFDYPGLSSPEVVSARKRLHTNSFAKLIRELNPQWLCLRPKEINRITKEIPALLTDNYEIVRIFDVSTEIKSYSFLPGRGYLQDDQIFTVFRKRH